LADETGFEGEFADETDTPDEGNAPKLTPRRDSHAEIAKACFMASLTPGLSRRLRAGSPTVVVVKVPSAQWVDAVASVASSVFRGAKVASFETAPRSSASSVPAAEIIALGWPYIAISQSPANLIPFEVRAASDYEIEVKRPNSSQLWKVMRAVQRGFVPRGFRTLDLSSLDLDELAACIAPGDLAASSAAKLQRAVDQKAKLAPRTAGVLPSLEGAIEYGDARRWALDLRQDLADLKAGRVAAGALDRGCLFYGPPGSGKSLLAQMIGEACRVPLISSSVGDWFAKGPGYLGDVIKAQRQAFEDAMSKAPAILFLDEIDALPNPESIDIAPLSFDPETFELLLSQCPFCNSPLGWRQANGVHMCDKCVDDSGMPSVDLRNFPQPVVEAELHEVLRFVAALIDHDPERVSWAKSLVVDRWSSLTSGDLFDAIVDIGMACVAERKDHRLATGPQVIARLTPGTLARAGEAFLSNDGFERLIESFRSDETQRSGNRGVLKAFGSISSLGQSSSKVHPLVRDAIASATREGGRSKFGYADYPGRMDPRQLSKEFGFSWSRFHRLADSGELSVVRTSEKSGSTRLLLLDEVRPLVEQARDAVPMRKAAKILSLSENSLEILRDAGILHTVRGAVRGLLGKGDYFPGTDLEMLLAYAFEGARPARSTVDLRTISQLLGVPAAAPRRYAAALLALASTGADVVHGEREPKKWSDLYVRSTDFFEERLREADNQLSVGMGPHRLMSAKVAAETLGVTLMAIKALALGGFLRDRGTTTAQFRADEVELFRRRYATVLECSNTLRTTNRDVRRVFAAAGFQPAQEFDGSPGAIFDRRALNWLARAKAAGVLPMA
jgi:hypothetical protein